MPIKYILVYLVYLLVLKLYIGVFNLSLSTFLGVNDAWTFLTSRTHHYTVW